MVSVDCLCGVTESVLVLDECQKEVRFCVHSAPGLVQRCVTCLLAEFFGRLLDVRELGAEGIERIVLGWN
nr:hypothetical protein [Halogeometricum limi]